MPSKASSPQQKAKSQANHVAQRCRNHTCQIQNLSPQRPQRSLSFPFLQWQQGKIRQAITTLAAPRRPGRSETGGYRNSDVQPEPVWALPSVRAWSAASLRPPAFPVDAFRAKGRRCQRMRHRGHCPCSKVAANPRDSPPSCCFPAAQSRNASWPPFLLGMPWSIPGCHSAGGGCRGTRHLSSCPWCPHHPPGWRPADLSWLQLLHRGLLCHMGHRGLGDHPVNPAHHPAGCGQCRGLSSWQKPRSRGTQCPGSTSCTSCSRCLLRCPKRSLVSFRFHVLLRKQGTAAQPEQTWLNSSSFATIVSSILFSPSQ